MELFNGLGVGLGNIYRLSNAVTRSVGANSRRRKRIPRWPIPAPSRCASELGRGWKVFACSFDVAALNRHPGRDRRPRRHPAHLDHRRTAALARAGPAHLLGRRGDAVGRGAARRLLLQRLGRCAAMSARCRLPSTRRAASTATGRCRSASARGSRSRTSAGRGRRLLLPDQLHADRRARRTPPTSTPSSGAPTRCPTRRSTPSSTACGARASTSAPTWPGASTTPAGGARARSSSILDGDSEFPTICGTGTEDYFGGAWNFEHPRPGEYGVFTTPYLGLPQVIRPDGLYQSQQRFGMYRWHIMDPIRFEQDLRVTIQALGWRSRRRRRYLPLQDDIASVGLLVPDGAPRAVPGAAGPRLSRR